MPTIAARLRKLTAPLLIGALAMSGVLITASPAFAAVEAPQVLTPVEDFESESRTVEVTGTGLPSATIDISAGTVPVESVVVAEDGTWETSVTYSNDHLAVQYLQVAQTLGGESSPSVERRFRIPDPELMFLDSPTDGAVLDTRNPLLTGRAYEGTVITATSGGEQVGSTVAEPGGVFTLPIHFSPGDARTVEILLEGVYQSFQTVQPVTITVTIPASPPAPVLTSPVGEVEAGPVVFSGTATPGHWVLFTAIPAEQAGMGDDLEHGTVVNEDGTWTTTLDLPAGEYRGGAYLARFGNQQTSFGFAESATTEFTFSVRAPVAMAPIPPPAAPSAAVSSPRPVLAREPALAATGAPMEISSVVALILFLLGTTAIATARRRALTD